MITITVTEHFGNAVTPPLVGEFDEMGGTIGRETTNTLVLPDPRCFISRKHASIRFRAGNYFIRDTGTATPVMVNGKALGNGHEARIGEGDEISIEGYTMQVSPRGASAAAAVTEGNVSPTRPQAAPAPSAPAAPRTAPRDDPLLAFGSSGDAANPFADLVTPAPPTAPSAARKTMPPPPGTSTGVDQEADAPAAAARRAPTISQDYDPMGAPVAQPARPAVAEEERELDFGPGANRGIDDAFGLDEAGDGSLFAPGHPLAPRESDAKHAMEVDPLVAMGDPKPVRKEMRAPQRNDTPEIFGSFPLPRPKPESAKPTDPEPGVPRRPHAPTGDAGPALDAPSRNEAPETLPPLPASETLLVAAVAAAPPVPEQRAPELARTDSAVGTTSPNPSSASDSASAAAPDRLLQAFLEGAGVPGLRVPEGVTPKFMNTIGQLLQESTQGTLDLLYARNVVKRQLQADMTVIVPKENNPLKFSPNVQSAMRHLLAPEADGFLPPREAIKDAYNDLRSHQLAFAAGMQRALDGLLASFHPDKLEHRVAQSSVIDALMPSNRKAKLWDVFAKLYEERSREAEGDFHTMFSREFLRAYRAQLAELSNDE